LIDFSGKFCKNLRQSLLPAVPIFSFSLPVIRLKFAVL